MYDALHIRDPIQAGNTKHWQLRAAATRGLGQPRPRALPLCGTRSSSPDRPPPKKSSGRYLVVRELRGIVRPGAIKQGARGRPLATHQRHQQSVYAHANANGERQKRPAVAAALQPIKPCIAACRGGLLKIPISEGACTAKLPKTTDLLEPSMLSPGAKVTWSSPKTLPFGRSTVTGTVSYPRAGTSNTVSYPVEVYDPVGSAPGTGCNP
jgi:hypothetical protein